MSALFLSLLLAAAAPEPPTVAVLYFDYSGKTAELEVLKKGLAQMLISDLSQSERIRLVERDRLEAVLAELDLGKSKKVDPATAAKIGKLLGARYLVLGGYFDLMDALRVDARVVEVETGRVVKSVGGQGLRDEFLELEQRLARDLALVLEGELPAKTTAPPATPAPKSGKPAKLKLGTAVKYSQALDAKDRKDKKAAATAMKEVVREQPDFSLAQLELADLVQ
jgi:TolB-like protein